MEEHLFANCLSAWMFSFVVRPDSCHFHSHQFQNMFLHLEATKYNGLVNHGSVENRKVAEESRSRWALKFFLPHSSAPSGPTVSPIIPTCSTRSPSHDSNRKKFKNSYFFMWKESTRKSPYRWECLTICFPVKRLDRDLRNVRAISSSKTFTPSWRSRSVEKFSTKTVSH